MDDQSRRQPKKTDHTMVKAFAKRWRTIHRPRLVLWIGLAFLHLWLVITTVLSLILLKDSWIENWMQLTLHLSALSTANGLESTGSINLL